ncbi:MAG: hypothetical protein JST05_01125 [Acidobacteria bacterium]|nr:hypothetical protein [Acidobacteriota bacterium]
MHSSAQMVFSVGGAAPIVALDTMAGSSVDAQPLQLDFTHIDGAGTIIGKTPLNFLVWPSEYLAFDMNDASNWHVTEFDDSAFASLVGLGINDGDSYTSVGNWLKQLYIEGPVYNAPEGTVDTPFTTAGRARIIHKPSLRYLVVWTKTGFSASGAVRAFSAGSNAPSSIHPTIVPYYYSTG